MSVSTWGEVRRRAQKLHICSVCGRYVEVGWEYRTWSYVVDDQFGTAKLHIHCNAMLNSIVDDREFDDDSLSVFQEDFESVEQWAAYVELLGLKPPHHERALALWEPERY